MGNPFRQPPSAGPPTLNPKPLFEGAQSAVVPTLCPWTRSAGSVSVFPAPPARRTARPPPPERAEQRGGGGADRHHPQRAADAGLWAGAEGQEAGRAGDGVEGGVGRARGRQPALGLELPEGGGVGGRGVVFAGGACVEQ